MQNAKQTKRIWAEMKWKAVESVPPYSPDLNTCDAVLFGVLRQQLNAHLQKTVPRSNKAFDALVKRLLGSAATKRALLNLDYKRRLQQVIDLGGELVS